MKGQQPEGVHPNSTRARSARDPELRRRLDEARREADEDLRLMEQHHRNGDTSGRREPDQEEDYA